MPVFPRVVGAVVAVIFLAFAILTLAWAIFLGWTAVADPALAAFATALSYLSIAALALVVALNRSHQPEPRPQAVAGPPWLKLAAPLIDSLRDRPVTTIVVGLAAGALAEEFQRGRRR